MHGTDDHARRGFAAIMYATNGVIKIVLKYTAVSITVLATQHVGQRLYARDVHHHGRLVQEAVHEVVRGILHAQLLEVPGLLLAPVLRGELRGLLLLGAQGVVEVRPRPMGGCAILVAGSVEAAGVVGDGLVLPGILGRRTPLLAGVRLLLLGRIVRGPLPVVVGGRRSGVDGLRGGGRRVSPRVPPRSPLPHLRGGGLLALREDGAGPLLGLGADLVVQRRVRGAQLLQGHGVAHAHLRVHLRQHRHHLVLHQVREHARRERVHRDWRHCVSGSGGEGRYGARVHCGGSGP